jgi:type I restriction enzyme S subunit
MSWDDCTLGDVVTLKRGHDLPNAKRVPGNVPVVSSSGFTGSHNQAKAEPPGVVTGRYGTIGEVFYVTEPYWPLNTALYAIDFHGNDPRFVSYFLRNQLRNYQSDKAAVPGVDRNVLHKLPARCPDPQIQQRIVSVLSAYDDLVENNQRRIALLEEAARLLYREWFVHFRFPGREHSEIIDGVPSGWEQSTIGEHCPLVYGKALKADTRIPGDCDVYGSSGIVGSHNKKLVSGSAIVVGRKGNVGSIFWARRDFWPIDTVYYVSPENSDFYTYYALQHVTFINTDVAVPGLNRDFAHSRKLLIPTDALLEGFHAQVEPIQAQIGLLQRQSDELAKARDLLLPRLMDGRLEI